MSYESHSTCEVQARLRGWDTTQTITVHWHVRGVCDVIPIKIEEEKTVHSGTAVTPLFINKREQAASYPEKHAVIPEAQVFLKGTAQSASRPCPRTHHLSAYVGPDRNTI